MVRRYVMTQIESLGYTTLEAANAARPCRSSTPTPAIDLLFTDVIMPGVDEWPPAGRRSAEAAPALKTLYTSGYTENAIVHHGRLDSGVLLLAKPYRKSELARMIRTGAGQLKHSRAARDAIGAVDAGRSCAII